MDHQTFFLQKYFNPGIVTDLSAGNLAGVVGAIQKGGSAFETFKGRDLQSILRTETRDALRSTIRQDLPGAAKGVLFPKQPTQQTVGVNAPATPKSATATVSSGPVTVPSQTKVQ